LWSRWDHPPSSSFRDGDCLLCSCCGSTWNLGYEAYCALGPKTYVSYLTCNFTLGVAWWLQSLYCVSRLLPWNNKGYCYFWVWCKALRICHLFLKAKGVSSFSLSSNFSIISCLIPCLRFSNYRFVLEDLLDDLNKCLFFYNLSFNSETPPLFSK
jgi:hypothetical protein